MVSARVICVGYALIIVLGMGCLPQWLDSAELVLSSKILAIGHPPGQPLFALTNYLVQFVPLGSIPFRYCVASAVTLLISFYLLQKVFKFSNFVWIVGYVLFSLPVWLQFIRPEVYPLQMLFFALGLYLLQQIKNRPDHSTRQLFLLFFLAGLAATNHPLLAFCHFMPMIVFALYLVFASRKAIFGLLLWATLFGVGGLLVYIYLPIIAFGDPPLNFGDPDTLTKLWWVISGKLYKGYSEPTIGLVYENLQLISVILFEAFTVPGTLVMGMGWYLMLKANFNRTLLLAGLVFTCFASVLTSQVFIVDNPDLYGYILPGLIVFSLCGLNEIAKRLNQLIANPLVLVPIVNILLLLATGMQLWRNLPTVWQFSQPDTDRFVYTLVDSVRPNSYVLTGSYGTFAQLIYFQVLEGLGPNLRLDYRGFGNDSGRVASFLRRGFDDNQPAYLELAITSRKRVTGEVDYQSRLAFEQLQELVPSGWFFQRKPSDELVKANYIKQKEFWNLLDVKDALHPDYRRQLKLNHYLHAHYYKQMGIEQMADFESSAADLNFD